VLHATAALGACASAAHASACAWQLCTVARASLALTVDSEPPGLAPAHATHSSAPEVTKPALVPIDFMFIVFVS
jgi:hypothetical protein